MTTARRAGTVSAATLSVMVLVLAAVHILAPDWSRRVGLDVWNYAALVEDQKRADAELAATLALSEQAASRIDACGHIVTHLIEGRLTLAEAAAELEPLLRTLPGFETIRELHYQAPTPRLGAARYAILRAQRELLGQPQRQAEVLARLEAEYAAMAGSDGAVTGTGCAPPAATGSFDLHR